MCRAMLWKTSIMQTLNDNVKGQNLRFIPMQWFIFKPHQIVKNLLWFCCQKVDEFRAASNIQAAVIRIFVQNLPVADGDFQTRSAYGISF